MTEESDELKGVWVMSQLTPQGTYALTIGYESDLAWTLTPKEAWAYARMLATQIARATFDAAVINMLTARLELPLEDAGTTVAQDLRPARSPVTQLAPLMLEPGVTAEGKPFLKLLINGEDQHWTWDVADAREHLLSVVEGIETIDLDASLYRFMTDTVGVESEVARAAVGMLGEHR